MYASRYYQDRIIEYQPVPLSVSDKIKAVVERSPVGYRQPPFISENGIVPLGVAKSVIMRRFSLWGRYE